MTKQRKLRNLEYYDLQDCFDNLYVKSKENAVFTNLMEIISNEDNIKLAYRNIKRNAGSFTSGTDNKNIKDIEKLSAEKLIEIVRNKLEYLDNRVSLYAAQYGKCAITGKPLWIDELHCHHKLPTSMGGDDKYSKMNSLSECKAFENGVRLGVILMTEVFADKKKPVE